MAEARLGMAALADGDSLSAAEDPADTIQGALERCQDGSNTRQATGIDVKREPVIFCFRTGSAPLEAVPLLDQTLQEEKDTDALLTRLAEARVNTKAA